MNSLSLPLRLADSPSDNFAVKSIGRGYYVKFVKAASSILAGSQGGRRMGRAARGSSWDFTDSAFDAFVSLVNTS